MRAVNLTDPSAFCYKASAFIILKYCASTKFGYLLRTAPPDLIEAATTLHDERVLQCLASILDESHPGILHEGHSPSAVLQRLQAVLAVLS